MEGHSGGHRQSLGSGDGVMPPSQLRASIIIATVNRAESLDRTLTSLRQLRYEWFEVIVSNGPSEDHTAEILAKHADFIRSYSCPQLNLSASRNNGLVRARGDIVVFIDDDAIPEPDWLEWLLKGYVDPHVAQVGGFIRDHTGFDYQCKYVIANRLGESASHDEIKGELSEDRYISLTGTNFSVRRDCLMKINGFDEEFIYSLDETDVNLRLHEAGWATRVIPEAEIHHKFAPSHLRTISRIPIPRTLYPQSRSKAYFCCVHGRKTRSLNDIIEHLVQYIQHEREDKTAYLRQGNADSATVNRLLDDLDRGTHDGVRDAFLPGNPKGISDALRAAALDSAFKKFPLPLPRERRLRVCLLSQDYPPAGTGGIGQWTRTLAVGLARRGHEVTVIARSDTDFPYIDFVEGVWVHRILQCPYRDANAPEYLPAPRGLVDYSGNLYQEILRIQAHRDFQVISGPIFDLEPLVALKQSGIPTVVSLHTTYRLCLPFKPVWKDDEAFLAEHVEPTIAKEKELLESAPFLLANTRSMVNDLERSYGIELEQERLTVVPHGLEDLSIGVTPFPPKPGVVRLLFVGRLELRKGIDLLLVALPGLLARHLNIEVDIVGDDKQVIDGATLRAKFESHCERNGVGLERVKFHGMVPRATLLRHYASCDIFVAPSRYESFGLIFIEAMMFAKPSVGIAAGGVPDVVTDGVNGLLIDSPDPALLADHISTLIDDAGLRARLGKAGRQAYEQKFGMPTMLNALENYFGTIARAKTAPAASRTTPIFQDATPDSTPFSDYPRLGTKMTLDGLLALSGDDFLRAAYRAVLGRDIDDSGLTHYRKALANGKSKAKVLVDLYRSDEAQRRANFADLAGLADSDFISTIYLHILGRTADPDGRRNYLKILSENRDRQHIIRALENSTEALRRNGTFKQDIAALVRKETRLLGWKSWLGFLDAAQARSKHARLAHDIILLQERLAHDSILLQERVRLLGAAVEGLTNTQHNIPPAKIQNSLPSHPRDSGLMIKSILQNRITGCQ